MSELPNETIDADPALLNNSPSDTIDHEDGTSTVILDSGVAQHDAGAFDENLAETMDEAELNGLARKYLELIDQDIQGREARDKQYADGLKKTGIAEPAPGGAPFEGASRATHPILAEAYIDFSAQAIKELFPPNGPVRSKIEGKPNHDKVDRATRKTEFLNNLLCATFVVQCCCVKKKLSWGSLSLLLCATILVQC